MTLLALWLVMGAALVAYAVTGGADYGGGVWHLLARGKRGHDVRQAIEKAIAPIWEANHVWLIFLIVMMFTVFPRAFSAVATALHIPITLALIGMVLRGAALVMRAYGMETPPHRAAWAIALGVASVLVPVVLGMTLAAVASGDIRIVNGVVTSGFLAGWLTPFAFAVGAFGLALFMLLAAVYLAYDAPLALRPHFRRRAYAMEAIAFVASMLVLWRAAEDAPALFHGLVRAWWAWGAQLAVFVLALAVVLALRFDRVGIARVCAAGQVAFVVIGFGLAMNGHIVQPDMDMHAAGARPEVMRALVPALLLGGVLVVPSLWWLFRLFKTRA